MSGVNDGEAAAGLESRAALPGGRVSDQAYVNVWRRLQVPALSASVTVDVSTTAAPGTGLPGDDPTLTAGAWEPQLVVVTVRNFGADLRPVESVATTEN